MHVARGYRGIVTAASFVLGMFSAMVAGYSGGSGSADDPYQIATAADLILLGESPQDYDKHFILVADIDLDPAVTDRQAFTRAVVAPSTGGGKRFEGVAFTGSFDGNGRKITNLTAWNTQAYYLGLFGNVGLQGRISDLHVENVLIRGAERVGGVAGHNAGRIANCEVSGQIRGSWYVGGLVGRNEEGTIDRCHAAVEVGGTAFLGTYGGLVGYNYRGAITNCSTTGKVSGHGNNGGLIGENYYGPVINCHATVEVEGESGIGGLIGANSGTVARCSAAGNVTGGGFGGSIGGLVGGQSRGTIVGCSASGRVTGADSVGGLAGSNSNGRIVNCSATGAVIGAGLFPFGVGGLVGHNSRSVVAYCWAGGSVSPARGGNRIGGVVGYSFDGVVRQSFWAVEASGLSESAGGTGLTREQMRQAQTFLAAGWDLVGERANGTADLWFVSQETGGPVLTLVSDSYSLRALGGSGTPADPYQIATPEDLGAICHYDYAAHYELTADIDLSGITWNTCPIWAFGGTLNGGGHRIANLVVHGDATLGLFGWLFKGAGIRDLGMERVEILGDDNSDAVGSLAGITQGEIFACYVTGHVSGGVKSSGLGGLVGSNHGKIADCYTAVSVWADADSQALGGLVGRSSAGTILRCYAIGGLGAGEGSRSLGGLVGTDYESAIRGCFWDMEAGGTDASAGGMGLMTAQMKDVEIYAVNGWAGEPNWVLDSGNDYPRLAWEGAAGQIIAPPVLDWLAGAGMPDDPHRITIPAQLSRIAEASILWGKAFMLTADLDLAGMDLRCIGLSPHNAFTGSFDGGGHVIANLTLDRSGTSASNQGLFGVIGSAGQVRRLRLKNATVLCGDGAENVGTLAGSNRGTITQCFVGGRILATDNCDWLGGLVGRNEATVSECHASVGIEAGANSWRLGGLAGANYMNLVNCHAEGDVIAGAGSRHLGGLVGYNEHITGGRATAEGWQDFTWEGAITHCYATGRVSAGGGDKYVGGLVGGDWKGVITSSYFLSSPAGAQPGGVGLPLTDEQMKRQASFVGWDFDSIWMIQEGEGYPRLRWE